MWPKNRRFLTNIANARAGVLAAGGDHAANIDANRKLDVALGPFFRLQEQYPNLKGNEQFMRLNDELAGTENRIAVERQRYNKVLRGLQCLRSAVPQQHLGRHGRLPCPERVLHRGTRRTMSRPRSTSRSKAEAELNLGTKKAVAIATALLFALTDDGIEPVRVMPSW